MTDGEGATRPRGLVRRMDDRMVAGVCSGLADHFGADPLLFRLGFVAVAVLGGAGILVYLAAWALIPPSDRTGEGPVRRALPLAAAAVLALVGMPVLVWGMNAGFPLGPGEYGGLHVEPLTVAAALVAVGFVLLQAHRDRPAPAEPDAVTAEADRRPRRVRRPRERSGLVPITLSVVLLVVGGSAAAASAGWAPLDVGQLSALSLLVVGLAVVVGAWYGRARLLVVLGILMVPVVLVTSLLDFPPTGSIGSAYVDPKRAGELDDIRVLAGQVTLDLSEYDFAEPESVRLRVAAGSMTVIVPHDVRVEARVSVEAGGAFVFGGSESGLGIAVDDVAGPEEATKTLDLDVVTGVGSVGIYRMREPRPARREREDGRKKDRGPSRRRDGDRSSS